MKSGKFRNYSESKKRSVILVCRALVRENYPPFDIDKYASDDCEPILIDLTPDSENILD